MARKSINFFGLKRLSYVRAGPLPGHKKNGFSVPGNCWGVIATQRCRNRRIGGLSLAAKIPQIVEGLEGVVGEFLKREWNRQHVGYDSII
jgi:hypothetical protein